MRPMHFVYLILFFLIKSYFMLFKLPFLLVDFTFTLRYGLHFGKWVQDHAIDFVIQRGINVLCIFIVYACICVVLHIQEWSDLYSKIQLFRTICTRKGLREQGLILPPPLLWKFILLIAHMD